MDIKEEYKNTTDKSDFFEQLSNKEKINLYNLLGSDRREDLLSALSFDKLKEFISIYPKKDRMEIYKNLSDKVLKQLYKEASDTEKQEIIQTFESKQMNLHDRVEEARSNISNSTSNIEQSKQSIENSTMNIAINKENVKQKQQELKANRVILKKLDKERKRNLKKAIRAQKKLSSPLNRIGIISKYRTQKYLDRVEQLQQTYQAIDTQKMTNTQIYQDINNLKEQIEKDKNNIAQQKQKIVQEQRNIKSNISKLERTEIQIKKLSKSEKKMLGRKLYHKVVSERNCVMICKKTQTEKFEQIQTKENQAQNIEPKVEKIDSSKVEVIEPQKNNTEIMVNTMVNNANQLQEMGVNFYPPAHPINVTPNPDLASQPIMQISQEQLIIMTYTMIALYNYNLQQMLQQQQSQNLTNGHTRTLSPNSRGNVNFALLASIIFFTLGLILFLIK